MKLIYFPVSSKALPFSFIFEIFGIMVFKLTREIAPPTSHSHGATKPTAIAKSTSLEWAVRSKILSHTLKKHKTWHITYIRGNWEALPVGKHFWINPGMIIFPAANIRGSSVKHDSMMRTFNGYHPSLPFLDESFSS